MQGSLGLRSLEKSLGVAFSLVRDELHKCAAGVNGWWNSGWFYSRWFNTYRLEKCSCFLYSL